MKDAGVSQESIAPSSEIIKKEGKFNLEPIDIDVVAAKKFTPFYDLHHLTKFMTEQQQAKIGELAGMIFKARKARALPRTTTIATTTETTATTTTKTTASTTTTTPTTT